MRTSFTLFLAAVGITFGLVLTILNSADGREFWFERQARAHCPSDTVVWVNTYSHIYHFASTEYYGRTRWGAYMCEADARVSGNRAAYNERHP